MKKDLIFVIFGSTGDLTSRKLLPAITNLYKKNKIPEKTLVLSLGRRNYDTNEYLKYIKSQNKINDIKTLNKITKYYKMQITDSTDYFNLKNEISKYSNDNTKVIYYLAVGPNLYLDISNNLFKSKIIEKNNNNQQIIYEKPFGNSYKSAVVLNSELLKMFSENQIYRIDHYLGKEMIQNIYNLRYNNSFLKEIWNSKYLKSIRITAIEEEGILNRGSFYDEAGVMKDMFQNHILQMYSLLTMKEPRQYNSEEIINEKVKALENFNFNKEKTIFGQYDGYLLEKDVKKDSNTETLLYLEAYSNYYPNVPIKILTGKKMNKKLNKIEIDFIDNKIKLYIDPIEELIIYINTKKEGLSTESELIKFRHQFKKEKIDAYEKLLLDIYLGKKESFTRSDEIEISWKITEQILNTKNELFKYSNISDVSKKIKGV